MLTTRSKAEKTITYLFESRDEPITEEELGQVKDIGKSGTIESTLTFSRDHPPIRQEEFEALKTVMDDCGNPYLKAAYDEGHMTLTRFLGYCGVEGSTYRIHTIKKR